MLDIERYIPHRPPMRLVDNLVSETPQQVVTAFSVDRDHVFFDASVAGVPTWAGIEFMAQTAAVWLGLADERAGRAIAPAFLISTRHYTVTQPVFAVGESFQVAVEVALQEEQIVSFNGRVYSSDNAKGYLAEAVFSAFRPDDAEAYLAASEPPGLSRW
ncbi:hypothetical protein [Gilvimarinus chinensis]|uniref:ApeP family dehydratase n=1 Tax=Gilvimarinus chinensis TaxID=396005 RepID=UPI000368A261|nr:hypothetical protein [Gilvimarinus chinensis]